nr:putative ORF1 [Marmot picobirnavirus]
MTQNQIAYQNYLETARSNRAREQEQHRAALVGESLRNRELVEIQRANRARESETYRSDVAREAETARSNLAREFETHRANTTSEGLTQQRDTWTWLTNNERVDVDRQHYIRADETAEQKRVDSRLGALEAYSQRDQELQIQRDNTGLRQKELDQRKREMWVNLGSDVLRDATDVISNVIRRGGNNNGQRNRR